MPRRVQFIRHTEVYFVPSHDELTPEEKRDAWYSSEERNVRLGADIRETVKKMRRQAKGTTPCLAGPGSEENKCAATDEVDGELCVRGLEHMRSSAHLEQRRINRDCVIQAVIEVQETRKAAGLPFCPAEVSVASSSNSRWARNMAASTGVSDAEFVRERVRPPPRSRTLESLRLRRRMGMSPTGAAPSSSSSAPPPRSHTRRRIGRRSTALMTALEIVHNSHSSDAVQRGAPPSSSTPPSPGQAGPSRQSTMDRVSLSQATSSTPSISATDPFPLQQMGGDDASAVTGRSAELIGHLNRMRAIAMRSGETPSSTQGTPSPSSSSTHGVRRCKPRSDGEEESEGNPQQA